jgi:hypothetical protein
MEMQLSSPQRGDCKGPAAGVDCTTEHALRFEWMSANDCREGP